MLKSIEIFFIIGGEMAVYTVLNIEDITIILAKYNLIPLHYEGIKDGVKLIHHKLFRVLSAQGLKPMESIGQDFNVETHEAITEIPSADNAGKVLEEEEKGYYLNDKIVRFAKVVVGK